MTSCPFPGTSEHQWHHHTTTGTHMLGIKQSNALCRFLCNMFCLIPSTPNTMANKPPTLSQILLTGHSSITTQISITLCYFFSCHDVFGGIKYHLIVFQLNRRRWYTAREGASKKRKTNPPQTTKTVPYHKIQKQKRTKRVRIVIR